MSHAADPGPNGPNGSNGPTSHHRSTNPDQPGVRLLVALYPPAWRARYADEYAALIADTGVGPRVVLDTIRAAATAWARPVGTLHAGPVRLRTTVTVLLYAWTALAACAVLFGKLAQDDAVTLSAPGHPLAVLAYDGFVLACAVSVLAMLLGGIPLGLAVVRRGGRARALLGVPVLAVAGFVALAKAIATVGHRGREYGIGAGWFVLICALGVLAGLIGASGGAEAIRRVEPRIGPLRAAIIGGTAAACAMAVAVVASILYAWAASQAARSRSPLQATVLSAPQPWIVVAYAVVAGLALAVAGTSSVRGLRGLRTLGVPRRTG